VDKGKEHEMMKEEASKLEGGKLFKSFLKALT